MSTQPPYTYAEATKVVRETATHPRVTKESIEEKIVDTRYLADGFTTVCIIEMRCGFKVIGHSTPASPENFNADVGASYAYDNACRQLWQLEGYLLRERLATAPSLSSYLF